MNIWAAIPLATSLAYIAILIFVLQYIGRRENRLFLVFVIAAGTWSFTSFVLHLNPDPNQTLLWNELLVIALFWTVISYYHFVRGYTSRPAGIGVYTGYFLMAVLAILALTGNIVKTSVVTDGIIENNLGISLYIIGAVGFAYFASIIVQLRKKYMNSNDPFDRNRTIYLIAGWSILVILSYTNLIPAVAGLPLDHTGNLINAVIIAYAITRFHLLDTKLVARRSLSYLLLFVILAGIYGGIIYIALQIFPPESATSIIVGAAVLALMLATMSRPLRNKIERVIDRLFYRNTYEHRQSLLSFSTTMGNILNLDELAKAMLPAMTNAIMVNNTALLFRDSANADFIIRYVYPEEGGGQNNFKLSADSPIVDWLDINGQSLNPEQIDSIAALKGLWQVEKEQVLNSGLGLLQPIKSQGKLIGILALGTKRKDRLYSHEDIQLVASIANQAGIIIENAHLYTQATTRANTDGLTGLYNHRHFHQRLEQEIARSTRFGTTFSLVMLDLDLFKAYNDIYGHLAGDQVLRKVGLAIESSIRSVDTAFRYGGEEFTIILPETRLDDAYHVAERIRKTIESKTSFREMPVTASLGIANWPNDGVMKEEVIGRADAALYRAKQTGRNRTCLSSEIVKLEPSLGTDEIEGQPKALSVIYALAATVDAKDHYTYGHSRKVSEYAVSLAEAAGLSPERVDVIRAAGLLHDIGKLGIPDSILTKPGALDESEWGPIKTHPELGVEILKRVVDLAKCLPAVLYHHEHYDGNGYPAGLKGENIPLEARILAIADAYDAITSPRPYHAQLTSKQAMEELKRCADSQFDPRLVEIFCKIAQPTAEKIMSAHTKRASDKRESRE